MVAASPPDFSVSDDDLFFLGKKGQQERESRVFRSGGGFFDEILGRG